MVGIIYMVMYMMERNQYEMIALYDKESHMYNVGCMVPYMGFTPKTLEGIVESYTKYKERIGENMK